MPHIPGLDGLDEDLTCVSSGGDAIEWMNSDERRFYTNAFIVSGGKLLLGYKKRGFGVHKYSGFGGKVDPGETPAEAAARELKEEADIEAPLKHAGTFLFLIDNLKWAFQIEIYRAESYSGTPIETDEMDPTWFDIPKIPYDKMWESDDLWLPLLLEDRSFVVRADYDKVGDDDVLRKWWVGVK